MIAKHSQTIFQSMIKKTIVLTGFVLAFLNISHAQMQVRQDWLEYVEQYREIAVREMERAGVPASIKLAQGLLESNAGKSDLASRANNHFGIKCGGDWQGKTYDKKDDEYDENGKLIESCFRVYKTVEACYVAHSEFLRDPKKMERYGPLFRLDVTDYRRWAQGLKRAGYATSGTYAEKLIEVIETYELHKYDKMTTVNIESPDGVVKTDALRINDVRYVLASPNETLSEIARRTDIALRNLLQYNEALTDGSQQLSEGAIVYIQPKRSSYRGRQTWHDVRENETMAIISQQYGVKLSNLYKRNRLVEPQEPAPGQRIKLRGGKVKEKDRPTLLQDFRKEEEPVDPDWIIQDDETAPPPVKENSPLTPKPQPPVYPEPVPDTPPTNNIPESKPPVKPNPRPLEEDPFGETPMVTPPSNPAPDKEVSPPTNNSARPVYHTVQKGDTLWNISQRYNTTVDGLRKLNNMDSDNIKLGQQLRVQ